MKQKIYFQNEGLQLKPFTGNKSHLIMEPVNNNFEFTIDTTKNGSLSDTFVFQGKNGYTYDYLIDWGDGTSQSVTTHETQTHIYPQEGIYKISISGLFPTISFVPTGDKFKVLGIDNWGDVGWSENQGFTFKDCVNMTYINILEPHKKFFNEVLTEAPMMFNNARLTSFPSGITFPLITEANYMFFNHNFSDLPNDFTFNSATTLDSFLLSTTVFSTEALSNFYIRIEAANSNSNVVIGKMSGSYNTAGKVARDKLIARGWTITHDHYIE